MTRQKTLHPAADNSSPVGISVLALVAVLACLGAYALALQGPLFFDDVPNLLANDLVKISGAYFDDWRVATISYGSGSFHRPVAMLSFALNYLALGEFSAFSLKATNVAIHLANAVLVYVFCAALLQTRAVSALRLERQQQRLVAVAAATIWLLHPIHASTVLYAVQRMAQLSTLFTLAGLCLFVHYRTRWAEVGATAGEVLAAFLWLFICTGLAISSKENGALLPWLVLVVEVTLFQSVWRGRSRPALVWLGWIGLLLPLLAMVLLVPDMVEGRYITREFTLEERLLTQARILWSYLGWLLVPNVLEMGFFHDDIPTSRAFWSPFTTGVAIIAWVMVLGAVVWRHKQYPLVAFAVLFFLVAHSMESSVWPLEMVFEHRNYLPSVGVFLLLAAGIAHLRFKFEALRLDVLVGGILTVLTLLLLMRTHAWSDETTLARFNVVNHPESPRANFFYANTLFRHFEQGRASGLSAEEQEALVVTSRRYFERMHVLDERDFAALVMLYQLDTVHFPALAEQNDWLGRMEALAPTRRLQSSDRTALGALVVFAGAPPAVEDRARIGTLLSTLVRQNPKRLDLIAHHFRFLQAEGEVSRQELQTLLERAAQVNKNNRKAAAHLVQFYGNRELDKTYEAIREWLRRDRQRLEVAAMREIFDN